MARDLLIVVHDKYLGDTSRLQGDGSLSVIRRGRFLFSSLFELLLNLLSSLSFATPIMVPPRFGSLIKESHLLLYVRVRVCVSVCVCTRTRVCVRVITSGPREDGGFLPSDDESENFFVNLPKTKTLRLSVYRDLSRDDVPCEICTVRFRLFTSLGSK